MTKSELLLLLQYVPEDEFIKVRVSETRSGVLHESPLMEIIGVTLEAKGVTVISLELGI